jgi:TonB-dependent starch-binding outer membrane protein SusC
MKIFCLTGFLTRKTKKKWGRIMRLTLFLIVGFLLTANANSYSQSTRLDIKLKNGTVAELMKFVEENSEFVFLYRNDELDLEKKLTIDLKDANIQQVLDAGFKDQNVVWDVYDRQIILRKEGSVTRLATPAQQQRTVTGVVTEQDGRPLPGVTVLVKGTTQGTVTDARGNFSLAIPNDAEILQFSFVGMRTQDVPIEGRTTFTVVMEEETIGLEEVVAVGYGTQKKVNLTGSVAAVKVDENFSSRALPNLSSGLSGLLPGLAINQNSGMVGANNVSILIRGLGTVNNANPLIVVDGMPDVDINRLNVNDIENISVLKDASSSAIYGSRAANGVILITTKTGVGERMKISISSSYTSDQPTNAFDFMGDYPRGLTLHQNKSRVIYYRDQLRFKDGTIDQWMALGMIDPLHYPNTNWWDVIMRNGQTIKHNVTVSGDTDRSNLFISLGVMDQKGLQIDNDYNIYNARFNYEYEINKNINVGFKFSGNWSEWIYLYDLGFAPDRPDLYDAYNPHGGLEYAIAGITPYDPERDLYGGVMAYGQAEGTNPYALYRLNHNNMDRQEVSPLAYFEWNPSFLTGLKIRADYSMNYYNQFIWVANTPTRAYNFQTEQYGTLEYVSSNAGVSNTTNTGYKSQFTGLFNYFTEFGDNHKMSTLLGYSNEYWFDRNQGSSRTERIHPVLKEIDACLTTQQTATGNSVEEGLISYFGRLNYSSFDKYFFEANFRYDGSSKFLEPYQYGFFPSASIGWFFTRENFLKIITEKFLHSGKIRLSYGGLGNNSGIGRYQQKEVLETYAYIIDKLISKGFVNRQMINRKLTWESTYVANIGLDLAFLNNRLTTEIDFYDRLTIDMLRPSEMSIHLTGAYIAPQQNIGELRNQGVEGNFTWVDNIGNLNYRINFNASYNRNRLEKWNEYLGRGTTFINMPLYFVYTYEDIGIAQTWQDVYNATPQGSNPGDILRLDLNGDGRISDEDRKAYPQYSSVRPTTHFGLNTSFEWKGISMVVFFQGAAGRKNHWLNFYNSSDFGEWAYSFSWNHWNEPWSVENRDGEWPRLGGYSNRNRSTFWLDDLAYLRVKNIQLSYTLNDRILSKLRINSIKNIRIFSTTENLFTFTKYRGLDPEKQGFASDEYPIIKSFTFGINIDI